MVGDFFAVGIHPGGETHGRPGGDSDILCQKLAAENYQRRYGALQYDASDNELSYRYSFSVKHGLYEDDFRGAFLAVVASAHASYDVVKQYAVGRFRRAERDAITCQAQKLIIELDQ